MMAPAASSGGNVLQLAITAGHNASSSVAHLLGIAVPIKPRGQARMVHRLSPQPQAGHHKKTPRIEQMPWMTAAHGCEHPVDRNSPAYVLIRHALGAVFEHQHQVARGNIETVQPLRSYGFVNEGAV